MVEGAGTGACARRAAAHGRETCGERRQVGPRARDGPARAVPAGWSGTLGQGGVRQAGRACAAGTLAGRVRRMLCLDIRSPSLSPAGWPLRRRGGVCHCPHPLVPQERQEPARPVCLRCTSASRLVLTRAGTGVGHALALALALCLRRATLNDAGLGRVPHVRTPRRVRVDGHRVTS
jgi:hypothetical protein